MKDSMSGARGRINSAASSVPKEAVRTRPNVGSVGNERKGDVKGAQSGGSMAQAGTGNQLKAAGDELRSQHPHRYDDRGPHHGGTEHVRHRPAVRPNGS